MKAGDKLSAEAQICVALGISRPPLREALKALLELVRFCVERANDEQRARIVSIRVDGHNFTRDPVGFGAWMVNTVKPLTKARTTKYCL